VPVNHSTWSHRGGTPTHRIAHAALNQTLTSLWSTRIGDGNTRRARITADPVAGGGLIFAMDAHGRVSAVTPSGQIAWTADLTPPGDRPTEASGGGLAFSSGRIYATTGFGRLHALDASSGRQIWRQEFDAPIAGSPTAFGDFVYVVSRDNQAFTVRRDTGRLEWTLPGAGSGSMAAGGSGPAVSDQVAVFPFGSAQLIGTLPRGGLQLWASSLAGKRRGRAYAGVSDITGDPVLVGGTVYAGSPAGRVAAIDAGSGDRVWTANDGAMGQIVPVGGALFFVSDQGQLTRLNAMTGETVWSVNLPFQTEERARRRLAIIPHYGPVLAGGRLYVGSGDGQLRAFDPRSGATLAEYVLPGGAASSPIVVNGTLYIMSSRGVLHAFR